MRTLQLTQTLFGRSFFKASAICALSAAFFASASAQEASPAASEQEAAAVESSESSISNETTASIHRVRKVKRKLARRRAAVSHSNAGGAAQSAAHHASGDGETNKQEVDGEHSNSSNAANDPTTPRWTIENDNYPWFSKFSHRSAGYEGDIRIVAPWKVGDRMILTRFNVPMLDTPRTYADGGRVAGPSDISMYNWVIFKPEVMGKTITFGIGPMFTFPVGKVNSISEGKWQAGATAVVVTTPSWGTAGAMFQWQKDIGDSSSIHAKGVNAFALQPFIYYNLPGEGHYYLRSTGILSYDTIRKTANVPIGFGIGKVFTFQDRIMNVWVEPQYSVARRGQGQTRFQVYAGFKYMIPGTVNSLFSGGSK